MTYLKIIYRKIGTFFNKFPVARGMTTCGILWPTSCYIQQRMEGLSNDKIDWMKCMRYAIYGGLISAPCMHLWVRITSYYWPQSTIKSAAVKSILEQITYEPIFLSSFFLIMSLMDGKTWEESMYEVEDKFWPTYCVSCCFWPAFQTWNFTYVHENNRVVMVSIASLGWVTYLAYMKQVKGKEHNVKNNK